MRHKRRHVYSPHIEHLFSRLFGTLGAEMTRDAEGKPTNEQKKTIRGLITKLLMHGVTPIEIEIEISRMRDALQPLCEGIRNAATRKAR